MKFGTILADPPWPYQATSQHYALTGYSDVKYSPLAIDELCELPVVDIAADDSVLVLWTTWPMLGSALDVIDAWGFTYVTGMPWVKVQQKDPSLVQYGVGYWFRGCTEPILIGKRGKVATRTNLAGILSPNLGHSRKPDDVYQICEKFPSKRLEMFARTHDDMQHDLRGWYQLGNQSNVDGKDIRDQLPELIEHPSGWPAHRVR